VTNPLFSIIIATKNSELFIKRCLDSIQSQTLQSYQVIISDGLSSDRTKEYCYEYINTKKIQNFKFLSNADSSIYEAWNNALDYVSGAWVIFLGSDDFLSTSSVLSNIQKKINQISRKVNFCLTDVHMSNRSTLDIFFTHRVKPWNFQQFNRFRYCLGMVPHQGVLHRANIFSKTNKFSCKYSIAGDYEFLLRNITLRNVKSLIGENFSTMSVGGVSGGFVNQKLFDEFLAIANLYNMNKRCISMAKIKFGIRLFLTKFLSDKNAVNLYSCFRK